MFSLCKLLLKIIKIKKADGIVIKVACDEAESAENNNASWFRWSGVTILEHNFQRTSLWYENPALHKRERSIPMHRLKHRRAFLGESREDR